MLSLGRWMRRSPVSTSVTHTGWPSSETMTSVIPSSAAIAFARSSASLVPPQVSPSNVLHSFVQPATKIFVRRLTVHESAPLGPNGATILPPKHEASFVAPRERVVGGGRLKHRRPQVPEGAAEPACRGGAGRWCDQAASDRC
jgi:hypothetical protein